VATLGLDKLSFLLPADELSITPDFAPKIERGPIDGKTLQPFPERELYTVDGVARTGRVAHFNTQDFYFDISPCRERSGAIAKVHFSAGAFRKSNFEPLQLEECLDVARRVQCTLEENGVGFDFKRAKLFRADIAQNCQMAYPVAAYAPALASVGARKRVRKVEFGVTGFYIGNKSLEIGFYDKAEQMKQLGYAEELRPTNSMRPEVRLQKARLIRDALGCGSLAELPNAWPQLRPVYNQFIKRDVFRPKSEQNSAGSLEFERLAALALDKSPRRSWQRFKSDAALLLIVQHCGIGAAKDLAATQFGYDAATRTGERQIARVFAELELADFMLKQEATARTGHKVKELYSELKRRVLEA
jgi:hypothetical protein